MAARTPIYFTSTDSNAKTMTGQAGKLTDLLNACLIVDNVFTTTSAESVFTDRSAACRTDGTAASDDFILISTSGNDRFYVGMTQKFDRMIITLGTLGVSGSYAVEYWNGSAWTAVSGLVDGTSGLTASGAITWTIPSDWTTKAVNSITEFWVRMRAVSAPSTAPQATSLTVTGWLQRFTGTNKYVYRQGGGNQLFMRIRDDAGGTGGAKEAQYRWFETIADIDAATNTGPMPTAAQSALTNNSLMVRKSNTADATARAWSLIADDRTWYLAIVTGDNSAAYYMVGGGDFFSVVPGDAFRVFMIARGVENSTALSNETDASTIAATLAGHFIQRPYTQTGGSTAVGKHGDQGIVAVTNSLSGSSGQYLTYPNSPDGGLYLAYIWISESTSKLTRGRLRGWVHLLHDQASFNNGDTFSGLGTLSAHTFVKVGSVNSPNGAAGNGSCGVIFDKTIDVPWESNS